MRIDISELSEAFPYEAWMKSSLAVHQMMGAIHLREDEAIEVLPAQDPPVQRLACEYCGQWGEPFEVCEWCGGPPPDWLKEQAKKAFQAWATGPAVCLRPLAGRSVSDG